MKQIFHGMVILILAGVVSAFAVTGEELLEKMDGNRDHSTMIAEAQMEIHTGDAVRVKRMKITAMPAKNRSVVEFLNPEDAGTKYLMIDDNLWIYFPEENDVVKISGHLLKEGMMGSDVSYEDALEADQLSEKYKVSIIGEEIHKGHETYVLLLEGTVRDAPYAKRKMWVGKNTFIAWKEEMYAKSGKLLKVSNVLETEKIGDRTIPTKTVMENKLRRNSRTVFTLKDVKLDVSVNEQTFTMRWLRR